MKNIEDIKQFVEKNSIKFISLKFVDFFGELKQLDFFSQHLLIDNEYIVSDNIYFKPVADKFFYDPFRSLPTIFCLSENNSDELNLRKIIKNIVDETGLSLKIPCKSSITFKILENDNSEFYVTKEENCKNQIEPLDKLANLRSEIIDTLEEIGIFTSFHYHAKEYSSCVIGISSENILEMADNLVISKYIIENVAQAYGKIVQFNSEQKDNRIFENFVGLELSLDFSNFTQDVIDSFAINIQQNTSSILLLFTKGYKISYQIQEKNIRIMFSNILINPYLAFGALIAYGFCCKTDIFLSLSSNGIKI